MNWDFYSKRRRISLQTFLFDVSTLEEAKSKFNKFGITPPNDDVIEYHVLKQTECQEDLSKEIVVEPPETDLKDTEYLRKNLFDSIKIPIEYLENKTEEPTPKKKKK
jgi:hypothetical protein